MQPSSPEPGTKPLGTERKGNAAVNSKRGLRMEVEEASAIIAGFEGDHQLVIRVGRQNLGHRDCSPCNSGIATPWQPEIRTRSSTCISFLPPPWHSEEEQRAAPACPGRPYLRSSRQALAPPLAAPTTGAPRRGRAPPGSARSGRGNPAPSSRHVAELRHLAKHQHHANKPYHYY